MVPAVQWQMGRDKSVRRKRRKHEISDRGREGTSCCRVSSLWVPKVRLPPATSDGQRQLKPTFKCMRRFFRESRSQGLFAGITLEGATVREDLDDNSTLYGKRLENREIVTDGRSAPNSAAALMALLNRYSACER